jgi:hypothetical protein
VGQFPPPTLAAGGDRPAATGLRPSRQKPEKCASLENSFGRIARVRLGAAFFRCLKFANRPSRTGISGIFFQKSRFWSLGCVGSARLALLPDTVDLEAVFPPHRISGKNFRKSGWQAPHLACA